RGPTKHLQSHKPIPGGIGTTAPLSSAYTSCAVDEVAPYGILLYITVSVVQWLTRKKASGKTSFVHVLGSGQWSEDVVPTVAFNLRKVRKGNVTLKIWDVAGQPRYRSIWERYCNGVDAVVFVVDSADKFKTARFELHQLLAQPSLHGVPLLVLGNKNDLEGHASVNDLIKALELDKIQNRPVSCYSISPEVLDEESAQLVSHRHLVTNAIYRTDDHFRDIVLQWLAGRSH
ncbi:ADP-ribosylation factor-like protein 8B, partial [Grifola frondosa]